MKVKESDAMKQARRSVAAWRKKQGGRGSTVPDAVWAKAVAAAKKEGLSYTAQVLRLNAGRLRLRLKRTEPDGGKGALVAARQQSAAMGGAAKSPQPVTFVDLGVQPLGAPKGVVVLWNRHGDRIRIEGATPSDVLSLSERLWGVRQ